MGSPFVTEVVRDGDGGGGRDLEGVGAAKVGGSESKIDTTSDTSPLDSANFWRRNDILITGNISFSSNNVASVLVSVVFEGEVDVLVLVVVLELVLVLVFVLVPVVVNADVLVVVLVLTPVLEPCIQMEFRDFFTMSSESPDVEPPIGITMCESTGGSGSALVLFWGKGFIVSGFAFSAGGVTIGGGIGDFGGPGGAVKLEALEDGEVVAFCL